MSTNTLLKHIDASLFKIAVITGWTIPDHGAFKNTLRDQLKKKLLHSYHDLNFEEIDFAFREYGKNVEDWGKSMNLSLIDKVLTIYRSAREDASRFEERTKKPPEQKIFSQDELDNSAREDAQRQYTLFIRGYKITGEEITKAILVKDGLMKEDEQVLEFFARMKMKGREAIYVRS